MPKLALAAGGTGGHLYPAIELGRVYHEQHGQSPLFLTRYGADADKVRAAGFEPVPFLDARPPASKKDYPGYTLSLIKGAFAAKRLLKQHRVTHLLGFGNYISMTAMALAPPSITLGAHEANGVLGRANRMALPRLKGLYLSFESAKAQVPSGLLQKVVLTGFPTRPAAATSPEDAKSQLGLPPELPALMLMGGSLGAKKLNQAMLEAIPQLNGWSIYWITGDRDFEWIQHALKNPDPARIKITAFEHRMPLVWRAVDLAFTRAGAGTLFEAWSYATPLITVPYPFAMHNHQHTNAMEWRNRFGCAVLEDAALTAPLLVKAVQQTDADKRREITAAMQASPPLDTAQTLFSHFFST